jgi:predicted nucleic acid-binding protein
VSCTGLLGVLLAAKQRGFVVAIRPLLDALRTRAGFWISDAVYAHFIQVSGEEQTP